VNSYVQNWFMFLNKNPSAGYAIWIINQMKNVPIHIDYRGKHLTGVADPVDLQNDGEVPISHIIYLDGKYIGTLRCVEKGWELDRPAELELAETLGDYLHSWYE
jgi:hypothetical protein